jgi:hypothetical protein
MKQIFTKSRLILAGKVVVSVVGVVITPLIGGEPFDFQYSIWWIPGFFFGVVIQVWDPRSVQDVALWRRATFVIASSGIYLAAYISFTYTVFVGLGVLVAGDTDAVTLRLYYMLFITVFIGTVPLPVAHGLLLRATLKRTLIAIASTICVSIVLLIVATQFDDFSGYGVLFFLLSPLVAIWQATYLISMFGFRKKVVQVEVTE